MYGVRLAVQTLDADARALQGAQALWMYHPLGLAAGTVGPHAQWGEMVENGFGQDAATAVSGAQKQDLHGLSQE